MGKNNYNYRNYYNKKKLIEPEEFENLSKLNIALFDNETINAMVEECQPHAGASEFQIHYHSLQVHIDNKGYEFIITIPVAYYNFNQEVSSGSVSYEMKEVNEVSSEAKLLVDEKVKELFDKLPILKIIGNMGFKTSYRVSDNGSIHRHPGDFSFSSVDYDKDPEEPGVIFRQMKAKDLYQTDSVIYLGGKTPKFNCTETRIVNVEPVKDNDGIKGKYTEIPTYSFISKEKEEKSKLYEIIGELKEHTNILSNFKTTNSMNVTLKPYPLIEEILKAFIVCEFKPDIVNVVGERIKGRIYGNRYTATMVKTKDKGKNKAVIGNKNSYLSDSDYWDEYDECYAAQYGISVKEEKEEVQKTMIHGLPHFFHEEIEAWLPIKCEDMSEAEIINYAVKHNLM